MNRQNKLARVSCAEREVFGIFWKIGGDWRNFTTFVFCKPSRNSDYSDNEHDFRSTVQQDIR